MTTSLRVFSVLAVLLLASLGILFVLDLIPRELLQTLAVKTLLIVGILIISSFLVGWLIKRKD